MLRNQEKIKKEVGVLFRFGLASFASIGVKVGITWVLSHGLNEFVSYFLTHCVLLFWSYFTHLHFTFRSKHSLERFWSYCKAVFLIKGLDIVLFSILFSVMADQLSLSVIGASIAVSLIRFFSVRNALGKKHDK